MQLLDQEIQARETDEGSTPSLFEAFSNDRGEFRRQIAKARSPEDCAREIRLELDRVENLCLGSLLQDQIGPTRTLIHILRESAIYLASRQAPAKASEDDTPPVDFAVFSVGVFIRITQITLLIAFALSAVPSIIGPVDLFAIIAAVILMEVVRVFHNRDVSAAQRSKRGKQAVRYQADEVGVVALLDEALQTIDHFNETVAMPKPDGQKSGARKEAPEVLEFFQRLVGYLALNKPQRILQMAELAPEILMRMDVRLVQFDPRNEEVAPEWFIFEVHDDPADKRYITMRPALVQGDEVLLKGRVIEPVEYQQGGA